ncbi:MAG: cyclodeaminase/cyclohydrolase family protein [Armatimonadota bacterium]
MNPEDGVKQYLNGLASDAPAPGGGSATALVGALGAALNCMVANFTVGKEKYADVEDEIKGILAECDGLRGELFDLMAADEKAYSQVAAAYKLPKKSDQEKAERTKVIQAALKEAADVPLRAARCCRRVLELAEPLVEKGNEYLISDAGVAAQMANAALNASWLNVEINLRSIKDEAFNAEKRQALADLAEGAEDTLARAWEKMLARM